MQLDVYVFDLQCLDFNGLSCNTFAIKFIRWLRISVVIKLYDVIRLVMFSRFESIILDKF